MLSSSGTPLSPWPGTVGMQWTAMDHQPTVPSPLRGRNPLPSHPVGHKPGRDLAPSVTSIPCWESPGRSRHYQPGQEHHYLPKPGWL